MSLQVNERRACQGCGEEIVGARTINGRVAPITVKAYDQGNVWLGKREGDLIAATLGGPLIEKAKESGIELHLNHFANCPEKGRFQS